MDEEWPEGGGEERGAPGCARASQREGGVMEGAAAAHLQAGPLGLVPLARGRGTPRGPRLNASPPRVLRGRHLAAAVQVVIGLVARARGQRAALARRAGGLGAGEAQGVSLVGHVMVAPAKTGRGGGRGGEGGLGRRARGAQDGLVALDLGLVHAAGEVGGGRALQGGGGRGGGRQGTSPGRGPGRVLRGHRGRGAGGRPVHVRFVDVKAVVEGGVHGTVPDRSKVAGVGGGRGSGGPGGQRRRGRGRAGGGRGGRHGQRLARPRGGAGGLGVVHERISEGNGDLFLRSSFFFDRGGCFFAEPRPPSLLRSLHPWVRRWTRRLLFVIKT